MNYLTREVKKSLDFCKCLVSTSCELFICLKVIGNFADPTETFDDHSVLYMPLLKMGCKI